MKQKLLLFAFTLLSTMLFSQSQNMAFEEWKNNTGTQNMFYKITPVTSFKSGDTYVAGATVTMNGSTDILLTKYYANGTFAWTQQYNGLANAIDFAAGVYIDNSDNIYVTGAVSNDTNNVTLTDLILIKYDNDGNQQWVTTYDAGVGGLDIGKDIIVDDSNGNVYVTGGSHNSSYNSDILMICFDVSGVQQWVNRYNYNSLDDVGYKISMPRGPSELLVTGACTSSTNNYKLTNIAVDASNGSLSSITTSTAVTTSSVDVVNDVVIDAQKNIYITGGYNVSGQGLNYYTMKMDSNLVIQWQQYYNGTSNLNDVAKGLDVDNSGNVYVTGYSTLSSQGRNFVTIKYNSAGSQQWAQTFNNSSNTDDEASDVVVDSLLNVYVTGSTISSLNQSDYYTIKYNSSGTKIWDIQTDAHHLNDKATNLVVDINNDIIITGQCETAPNTFEYTTVKYVQKDIITPTDFNGETPSVNFMYYKNRGQIVDTSYASISDIIYYTHNTSPSFYFKNNSQSFVFSKIDTIASTFDTLQRVDLSFNFCNESSKTYPMEQVEYGYLNYFLGHLDSNGVTNVFGNKRLITPNLYNNIDLMCSSNQDGIKYYFIIKPGADMRDIKMEFTGASSYSLNGTTNKLSINSSIGSLEFDKPIAYQLTSSNATVAVSGWTPDWQTNGASNKFKFNNGVYTSSLTLVIEFDQGNTILSTPTIQNMNYSTYYGAGSGENFNAVRVNQTSNRRYVAGATNSNAFPAPTGLFSYMAVTDAVVLGFTGSDTLIFATFYGGTEFDAAFNLTIQSNRNIYISGRTSSLNIPIKTTNKPTATQQVLNGYYAPSSSSLQVDGFILELNHAGNNHVWSRYVGGIYYDDITDITVDASDNLYVVGYTNSPNFPTFNAYKSVLGSSSNAKNNDWFIMKFNSQSQVQWSTFYGGDIVPTTWPFTNIERAYCVDVDNSNGNVYVGGMIGYSQDFPSFNLTGNTSSTAFYNPTVTGSGAALVRFKPNGVPKLSTQLASVTSLDDLKVLPDSSVLMIGTSLASSSIFSHKNKVGAYNKKYYNSDTKGVIMQMTQNIDSLWSTFYSHAPYNFLFNRIAVADNGYFCISGSTNTDSITFSSSSPSGMYTSTSRIGYEGHISYFNPTGAHYHTHFLGGTGTDYLYDIDFYRNQDLYAVGVTNGTFPTASTPQNAGLIDATYNGGGGDGFITRFVMTSFLVSVNEMSSENDPFIKLFPNPVSDYFIINTNGINNNKNFTVTVYDILGKEVFNQIYPANSNEFLKINCNQWANGLYLINIKTAENKFSGKIIKQ